MKKNYFKKHKIKMNPRFGSKWKYIFSWSNVFLEREMDVIWNQMEYDLKNRWLDLWITFDYEDPFLEVDTFVYDFDLETHYKKNVVLNSTYLDSFLMAEEHPYESLYLLPDNYIFDSFFIENLFLFFIFLFFFSTDLFLFFFMFFFVLFFRLIFTNKSDDEDIDLIDTFDTQNDIAHYLIPEWVFTEFFDFDVFFYFGLSKKYFGYKPNKNLFFKK